MDSRTLPQNLESRKIARSAKLTEFGDVLAHLLGFDIIRVRDLSTVEFLFNSVMKVKMSLINKTTMYHKLNS